MCRLQKPKEDLRLGLSDPVVIFGTSGNPKLGLGTPSINTTLYKPKERYMYIDI